MFQFIMKYSNLCYIIIILSNFCISYTDSEEIQLDNKSRDGTTTAVPLFNSTKVIVRANETSPSTLTSTIVPDTTERYTTSGPILSSTDHTTKLFKYTTTNVIKSRTTTAMPLGASNTFVERKFDALSFMGGCLFTVSIITIGIIIWRMYEARIERSYLTI